MADTFVAEAQNVFQGTVGSTDIPAGSPVYNDGTDWELADATDNTKYATAISVNTVKAGEANVSFCTSGIVVDTDAPYTLNAVHYLSETAGAVTATRPTTTASLRQVVGYGLSTSTLRMEIKAAREEHASFNFFSAVTTEAVAALDTGNFAGVTSNADAEILYASFAVPQNCVGLVFARVFSGAEVVTGATDYTVTVSGAADGEQHDAITQDATLLDLIASGAVADEIQGSVATTALDAAGIIEPDNVVGFKMVHDGAQTDVVHAFALQVVYLVV